MYAQYEEFPSTLENPTLTRNVSVQLFDTFIYSMDIYFKYTAHALFDEFIDI